jgi:hypothetical protein
MVIRMSVGYLKQWGASWGREKGLREGRNSKELWKSVEKPGAEDQSKVKSWKLEVKTPEAPRQENQKATS